MRRILKAAVAALILALAAGFAIAYLPDLRASSMTAYRRAALFTGWEVVDPFDARSTFRAKSAYKRGDYATAMRLLRPLADQGDAKAQNNIGVTYANGQGVPQNYAAAVS